MTNQENYDRLVERCKELLRDKITSDITYSLPPIDPTMDRDESADLKILDSKIEYRRPTEEDLDKFVKELEIM